MALRKTLGRRFSNVAAKLSSPDALPGPPRPAPSLIRRLLPVPRAHEPGLLGRFFHRTSFLQSASPPPPLSRLALPVGDGLLERIREMNTSRIRLEGLLPPPPLSSTTTNTEEAMVSAAEVRKVVRAARAEAARTRLRETGQSCVSYSEFARVCREAAGGTEEGVRLGAALDESASVIVLGDVVLIRPEMVTALIHLLSYFPAHPQFLLIMYPSKQEPYYDAPPPPTNPYYSVPPPSTGIPVTAPPGTFQVQGHQPPTIGPWSTGLCDCCANPSNCCITCLCPCITFGQIAEIVDRGSTSCGASGALYALLMFLTGCACLYACCYRSKLRAQFGLREAPCNDCLVHCCCEGCSLCQMYRELSRRGFDMSIGWHGNMERQGHMATMPPPAQGMTR